MLVMTESHLTINQVEVESWELSNNRIQSSVGELAPDTAGIFVVKQMSF